VPAGRLLSNGDPIPGFSFGTVTSVHSSMRVTTTGAIFVTIGTSIAGGTTILYRIDGSAFTPVLVGGAQIGNLTVQRYLHNNFYPFQVSDNGAHVVASLACVTGFGPKYAVYVDGKFEARFDTPVPGLPGQIWAHFRNTAVDDSGNWLVAGETTSGTEVLAVNGVTLVKEGGTLSGIPLAPQGGPRALKVTAGGRVAFIWLSTSPSGYADHLFHATSPEKVTEAQPVFTAPHAVDFDGDGANDATIVTLVGGSGPPQVAISGTWIYCRVRLSLPGGGTPLAIVRFPIL
jgi:hypothetical protein